MNWEHVPGQVGGQPGVTIVPDSLAQQYEELIRDNTTAAPKAGNKKAKNKGDKSPKKEEKKEEKKPVPPIVPSFEGYVLTVLDATRPGEPTSWVRTRKAQMPFSSQELYDKAMAHQKKTGLGLSGQFQNLGTTQQALVNRLVAEKNLTEKEPNAEWKLFGVKKLHEERRSTFKTYRVNNAIRVTLRRGDKAKDTVHEAPPKPKVTGGLVDQSNIVDLNVPLVKEEPAPKEKDKKEKEKENEKKDKKNNKEKKAAKAAMADQPIPIPIPMDHMHRPTYEHDFDEDQYYPEYPEIPRRDNWSTQTQNPDPFRGMHDMSGALPADPPAGAIPIPPQHQYHDAPPEVPMAPLPQHFPQGHPFQPDPRLFAQPYAHPVDQFDERRPRTPVAYEHQPMSARRPSHSRPRSEHHAHAEPQPQPRPEPARRDSVDGEVRRQLEAQRLAAVVRDEVRGAIRDATAENKVMHHWPTSPSGSGGSSRSLAQEDFWSNAGSSGDRRPSYSTPGTSPDRGERYFLDNRPADHLRRRDSAGPRPYVDERKRYYPDQRRGYIVRPHETYRDRDHDRGRAPRYLKERRQSHDDYPTAHSRQRSRDPQYDMTMRPRVMRAVTDYPANLRDADFHRSDRGRDVDYERVRMNDRDNRRGPYTVHEVRQDGRNHQRYW